MKIRRRHRLKKKEIRKLSDEISESIGAPVFSEEDTIDRGSAPEFDVIFVNGRILAFVYEENAFPTVRGLLEYGASKRYVTVDMGAVGFVCNGADVMGPGVVDADISLNEGDLVWIRDENNRKPLAVGKALVPGTKMLEKEKGKVIASLLYVGDKLWKLDED